MHQSGGALSNEETMGSPHSPVIDGNRDGALRTRPTARHDPVGSDPAALPESEANLHLVLDAAQAGMLVWRIREDRCEADGRMLVLLGRTELHTSTLSDFIALCVHPDDAARVARAFAR